MIKWKPEQQAEAPATPKLLLFVTCHVTGGLPVLSDLIKVMKR